jgi:hypothetical protein
MDVSATDLLRTYSAPSLQQMCRQRGVQHKGSAKESLVQALARVLYDPVSVQRAFDDLAPVERHLVDLLILAGGDAPTSMIQQQLEKEGRVDKPVRDDRYGYYYGHESGTIRVKGSRKFEDVVARLGALCIVFTVDPTDGYGKTVEHGKPGRRLLIPDQILRQLPNVRFPVETIAQPPVVRSADPAPMLRDVYLLLSLAARESIPLTARGAIVKKTLTRINQTLSRPEDLTDIRSEEDLSWIPLLRALAEELGALAPSVGELVLDPRAAEILKLPAGERRRRLFDAYRNTSRWFDVMRIPGLTVRGKGVSLRVAPPAAIAARKRVLAELAEMPVGEWIAVAHLVDRMRLRAYEFLLSRRGVPSSYYSYGHGNRYVSNPYIYDNPLGVTFEIYGKGQDDWDIVEGEFIWVIVTEVLHGLGIVDLAGDDQSIKAFRVTEDGGRLLRNEPLPEVVAAPNVVVQPNFQIFAFEPTGEDVLFTLDQIANRVSAQQAIEYELTRDSVYRAQRAGMDTQAIVSFLESVSSVGIPQNVRRTLEDWGGQLERVTLRRRAPLLQTTDEATMDALYVDPEIGPLLGRRLAPTVAIVANADLRRLSDRLIASDRLPALTEGPDDRSAPAPRLSIDGEGKVAFRHQLPSLFDLSLLRPFVDEASGEMRLTSASLRRAARAKRSADEMIATLERLQAGPLLPEVAAFVRKWAKDWGRGALVESVILQVAQAETLSDLLADPEVKLHLQAIPSAPTLALVRSGSVDRLRELLDARGMALGDQLLR